MRLGDPYFSMFAPLAVRHLPAQWRDWLPQRGLQQQADHFSIEGPLTGVDVESTLWKYSPLGRYILATKSTRRSLFGRQNRNFG